MEKNVDTAPFRMAIWYWVLYEKGMVHDDYNYDNWSTLNPKVSNYARRVSCRPEDVTLQVTGRTAGRRASKRPALQLTQRRLFHSVHLHRTTTTWAWTCSTGKRCTSTC